MTLSLPSCLDEEKAARSNPGALPSHISFLCPEYPCTEEVVISVKIDDESAYAREPVYPKESFSCVGRLKRNISSTTVGRRKAYCIRSLISIVIVAFLGALATLVWLALVLTLIHRLRPNKSSSGLDRIAREWRVPLSSTQLLNPWPKDFSQDTLPKACHSHNDYRRRVPLYDALSAGCTGVEADIWLPDNESSTELRVGHSHSSLTTDRTLSSLYINPLTEILQYRNLSVTQNLGAGIFDVDSNETVTLLLDFKSNGTQLWPFVQQNLEPLRRSGWLRHWNSTLNRTIPGPLTIVATGNAPYELIIANRTYRDIFFDAPLNNITSRLYDNSNSYYASVSMTKTIGTPWFGHFSGKQMQTLTMQINDAAGKGLLSRYWDTPNWPVSVRDRVWDTLVKSRVGMLNVDDLDGATRWNWNWCVVAGLTLCG